jgi:8-oxo-dGTP pyrophosphatase MutT (NUDIX family)
MIIFIANKTIRIVEEETAGKLIDSRFNTIIDLENEDLPPSKWFKNVIVKFPSKSAILTFFEYSQKYSIDHIESVTFLVKSKEKTLSFIKSLYKVVKAAGGVVFDQNNKILLMKRLGKWDLPKGKAESGENSRQTAEREVEEECGIKVKLGEKICTTWHTYLYKEKWTIKRTKWYYMQSDSTKSMTPQAEEGIEELKWVGIEDLRNYTDNTYESIRYVLKKTKITPEFMEV